VRPKLTLLTINLSIWVSSSQ